jgi:tetratricopeptide (TPR) repeat protein
MKDNCCGKLKYLESLLLLLLAICTFFVYTSSIKGPFVFDDVSNIRDKNLGDAIKQYREAIDIKPDYVEAYFNLGNALTKKGDVDDAIYNYRKALQIDPDFFKSYYNIAKILYGEGKIAEAIDNFQRALTINKETPQTLFNLSWIYSTSENKSYRNGKKAVKLAEKLCRLTGHQQPLALDALAAAYAENGNFNKAVEIA